MKNFLRLLVLLPAIVLASGTTATLAWVLPVAYSDGSALPVTDIASVTINWAPTGTQEGPTGSATVVGAATTAVETVPCGSTTFEVKVTTTATAKYPNATSGESNTVPYATGIQCVPNPATGLTAS